VRGVEAFHRVAKAEGDDPDGELTLTLVGHFWRADFLRTFGREFCDFLALHQIGGGRLSVQDRRLLCFREGCGAGAGSPVLGYAWTPWG
jgi:hypothetical protein